MHLNKRLILAATISACLAAPAAQATNGYFSHGFGTKNKGMAGAGSALPQDALAAANNPAGMVFIGNRMDIGAALFNPNREYKAGAPTGLGFGGGLGLMNGDGSTVESGSNLFVIPHFGRNWMLDSERSIGLSVYGNGGMNSNYNFADTPGNFGTFGQSGAPSGNTGVDLAQLFINTTYAQKIDNKSSWGASAIVAYQRFKARGLVNFSGLSNSPNDLTNNGYDSSMGLGFRFGYQGDVSPAVTLAVSYQTEIDMGEFDDYKGLFAEKGDFDIPANYTLGIAWKTSPKSTLTADIQEIMYSDVAALGNSMQPSLTACAFGGDPSASTCLGGSKGVGFGWNDMTIIKLGYQWETSSEWTWRVGYSHTDQPIDKDEVLFNILAPGVIEDHLSFGFTHDLNNDMEVSFAGTRALSKSVKGNPTGDQEIELTMDQWELEASVGWKF